MNNKKAVICTVLFAVVLIGISLGSIFVKIYSDVSLYDTIINSVFMLWICSQIKNFYNWLLEE